MKSIFESWRLFTEGGWDSTATQSTDITPSVIKSALEKAKIFIEDFNSFLQTKEVPTIQMGAPLGSSAYYEQDMEEFGEDKLYGDVDLQIIVPEMEELEGKTPSQVAGFWTKLMDEFISTRKPPYVHEDSKTGHPILEIGPDSWVQVDMIPHEEPISKWGRYRTTPERGVKGLIIGNVFSSLGEILNMSIQSSGVQFKLVGGARKPYPRTRKFDKLVTLTTDIENFVTDIFKNEFRQIVGTGTAKVDPRLKENPGLNIKDVKVETLMNAVKGLAYSFEMNDMYGKGDLIDFNSPQSFLDKFWKTYEAKALKNINSSKRDKAETPEAKAKAEADIEKIKKGLEYAKELFNK